MTSFGHFGCSLEPCAFGGGGVLALQVYPFMRTGLGLRRCANRWTRPLGGGRWGHYLRDLQGVHWFAQKFAHYFLEDGSDS